MITIIGAGKMALAIAKGLQNNGYDVAIAARDEKKLEEIRSQYDYKVTPLQDLHITDQVIILAVKPHALEDVAKKLKGKARLLISILAGTTIEKLHIIPAQHYIRAMPNIAAAYDASTTAVTGDAKAKEEVLSLLNAIGKAIWVETEKELDIATAMAGSGPAFLAIIAEAIADGGVHCGLKRELAHAFTQGLFRSFASLQSLSYEEIKQSVMSPGGTTAAGLKLLENRSIRGAMIDAIEAAYLKTQKN